MTFCGFDDASCQTLVSGKASWLKGGNPVVWFLKNVLGETTMSHIVFRNEKRLGRGVVTLDRSCPEIDSPSSIRGEPQLLQNVPMPRIPH